MKHGMWMIGVVVSVPLALAAGTAGAVPIAGTGEGAFSDLSNCDNAGSTKNCRITKTDNGAKTVVEWGSTDSSQNFVSPSKLTAVDQTIDTATGAKGVKIAHLQWYNSPTDSSLTPGQFGVNWTLTIAFTLPDSASDTQLFALDIDTTTNPAADTIGGLSLADLGGLSWTLDGVVISNLKYLIADGAGGSSDLTPCPGGSQTCFINNVWYNVADNHANLYITADFAAAVPAPEPVTLSLLGVGLLGLGAGRRRARTA